MNRYPRKPLDLTCTADSISKRWTPTRWLAQAELTVIDEAVRTNAPGIRYEKRYRDIRSA